MDNLTFERINYLTCFTSAEQFASEQEVRDYFTQENMRNLFGDEPNFEEISQEDLNAMAEKVIRNGWNM